jgi:hypothetical protein
MHKFRIQPQAVCRTLLGNLDKFKPLTASEEATVLSALKSTGIDSCTDRLLAGLSRNTLREILRNI